MFESHISAHFLLEAIATATYFTNRLPTKFFNFQTLLDTLSTFAAIFSTHFLRPVSLGMWYISISPKA